MPAAASAVDWPDAQREAAFWRWFQPLATKLGLRADTLAPASADASFRRYLRVLATDGSSRIVMDAPPPQEDVRPFIDIAGRISAAGLHAPAVLAADEVQGFVLLADLGRQLYLPALQAATEAEADRLMREAVAALVHWQRHMDGSGLPVYDDALLRRELALFPDWCVQREHGITWTAKQQATWDKLCDALVASALDQPRVVVHRDWMPRNLMLAGERRAAPSSLGPLAGQTGHSPAVGAVISNPGILDFQDAVVGPVTYDIASLLRDAFHSWDEAQEIDWAARWWQQARDAGLLGAHPMAGDFGECWRALE